MRGRRSYDKSIAGKRQHKLTPRLIPASTIKAFPSGAVGPKPPQKLSPEAQEILRTRVGYRTEGAYGEGYRDAKAVIEHETKELGNSEERREAAKRLGLPGTSSLKQIGDEIDRRFGPDAKVLWLATKEGVKYYLDSYNEDLPDDERPKLEDETVDKYTIPTGALLLTDLGYDGQLFLMTAKDYDEMEKSATSVPMQ